jgi:hypothetical protein
VRQNGERLRRLIDDLLTYNQLTAGAIDLQPLDLLGLGAAQLRVWDGGRRRDTLAGLLDHGASISTPGQYILWAPGWIPWCPRQLQALPGG